MATHFEIISPGSGQLYTSIPYHSTAQTHQVLNAAQSAFKSWKSTSLDERATVLSRFVDAFVGNKDEIAQELAHLIGR